MPIKNSYIFILQDDDGNISVGRKADIENEIQEAENDDREIDFKTIGRIQEPLTVDFPAHKIEWYDKEDKDQKIIDRAIMTIINFIK